MSDPTTGLPPSSGAGATHQLRHTILQAFALISGMALLGFGVSALSEYFIEAQTATAYRVAPQCETPAVTGNFSCISVVAGTVTQVSSWRSKYGSSHRVDLSLPTGSQTVWLADGPPPQRGAPVGVKLWHGRATLLSAGGRLIETTDNPLWLEIDALLRAMVLLAVGAGMLLLFAWHWRAAPALGPGLSIDTIGKLGADDGVGWDPSRLVLRPVRRSDAPHANPFGSIGTTYVILRMLPLAFIFLGGLIGDPPIRHQRLLWAAPMGGALVAAFVLVVAWRELYLLRGRLFADGQDFGATNWLGIARRYPRSQLQRIVVMYVDYPRAGTRAVALFVSNSGQVLMRLPVRWWRRDQVQRLASFLGIQVENLWDPAVPTPPVSPVTPAQLRAQFRGGEPYWSAHPTITAWVLTPIVLVAVGLLVLALQGH